MPDDDHARILSWLQCIGPTVVDGEDLVQSLKRRRSKNRRLQMPTPTTSTAEMNDECDATPPTKRRRPNIDDGFPDTDRTPRGSGDRALSASSSRSSATSSSRLSPTKHLARLEVTPENPVLVAHIRMSDNRMPPELRTLLGELDAFQSRAGIVPRYLAAEVQARARNDKNFHNIQSSTFKDEASGSATIGSDPDPDPDPKISVDQVVKIFEATEECLVEDHAEATWNTIVHWPVFELALGTIRDVAGPAPTFQDRAGSHSQEEQARVRGMPCTAARLTGRSYGSKMVDYCMFVEPQPCEAAKIADIRGRLIYINHTDYHALRQRPIVLSAESKKPSEGGRNAQLQLSVWQAAQWAFFEDLVTARETAEQSAMIPFLPALIIHGHEWHFAATTRSGNTTLLWVRQPLGATDSILGIFQIVCALRHIAAWIRGTYWPWYRRTVLGLPDEKGLT